MSNNELNNDSEFDSILNEMRSHPEVFSRVQAPVGYEQELLLNLRKQLNPAPKRRFLSFFSIKSMGFAFSGALVVLMAFTLFQFQSSKGTSNTVIGSIVSQGGADLAAHWAASHGDLDAQGDLVGDWNVLVAKAEKSGRASVVLSSLEAGK